MINGRQNPDSKLPLKAEEGQVLVRDVAGYLLNLAKLHDDDKIGNPELSKGLRQVARVLGPFASYPAQELTQFVRAERAKIAAANPGPRSRRGKPVLPPELETLSHNDIANMLWDYGYTKQQIAELGSRRFGISRPLLMRLRKEEAWDSIRAALEHEKSLDAIARQARKVGRAMVR